VLIGLALLPELFGAAEWAAGAVPAEDSTTGVTVTDSALGGYGIRYGLMYGIVATAVIGFYIYRKRSNAAHEKTLV